MNEKSQSEKQKADKDQSNEDVAFKKDLIEAALYAPGYPLELKTLCSITHIYSQKKLYELVKSLVDEYKNRRSALEVLELEDKKFVMQLKPKYVKRIRRLSIKPLLTEGPLRTLSYIAYRQPVAQAKVSDVRGVQTYEHVRKLLEMGLITRAKFGKSYLLKTSELFASYFDLSKDRQLMKRQLETLFSSDSVKNRETELSEEKDVSK